MTKREKDLFLLLALAAGAIFAIVAKAGRFFTDLYRSIIS